MATAENALISAMKNRKSPDEIFFEEKAWSERNLDEAMLEALISVRVEWVKELLERMKMDRFLTVERLRDLYNMNRGQSVATFGFLMKVRVLGERSTRTLYTLDEVGVLTENLIGGSYVSPYTQPDFGRKKPAFPQPFNDLLVWAVLTLRHSLAVVFWDRGVDAMARGLVAGKLCHAMSIAIRGSAVEEAEELNERADVFEKLTLELLDQCFTVDDTKTQQLLTYEMKNWPGQTVLSLAVTAENRQFLAHPCCQILLADLWHGGVSIRKQDLGRVLLVILCPALAICLLRFKTKTELALQPQKASELKDAKSTFAADAVRGALSWFEKFKEFACAPITTFWIWTISYVVFLCIFTHMVLVETKVDGPSVQEMFVFSYAATYFLEQLRRIVISEPRKWSQKIVQFFDDRWQFCSFLAFIALAIGLAVRFVHRLVWVARVIYAIDGAYWIIRLLELMEVSQILGQYIAIIAQMLPRTKYMVAILLLILWCYGVLRQAILHPDFEDWDWNILRNVTFKPYFMWYGEVFPDEIQGCSEDGLCVPGSWIVTMARSAYQLLSNIILINLLIAMFTYIYDTTNTISGQIWKFRRYNLVMTYEQHPFLPPPLTIFYHVYFVMKCTWNFCCQKYGHGQAASAEYVLKLALKDEDVAEVVKFEEERAKSLKELVDYYSQNQRFRRVTDMQDFMISQLNDLISGHDRILEAMKEMTNQVLAMDTMIRPSGQDSRSIGEESPTVKQGPSTE